MANKTKNPAITFYNCNMNEMAINDESQWHVQYIKITDRNIAQSILNRYQRFKNINLSLSIEFAGIVPVSDLC